MRPSTVAAILAYCAVSTQASPLTMQSKRNPQGYWSTPAVTSWESGRLDVFVKGTGGQISRKWFDYKNGWQNGQAGGYISNADSCPTAVSRSKNTIDLFARGTDNNLYYARIDETQRAPSASPYNTNTAATRIASGLTGNPSAVSLGGNVLDVYFRGQTDNVIYYVRTGDTGDWVSSPFSKPSAVGARQLTSKFDPSCVSRTPGVVDCFAVGGDSGLYHTTWQNNKWCDWTTVPGVKIASSPKSISASQGQIDVFVIGNDQRMYHQSWHPDSTTAGAWLPKWEPMGDDTIESISNPISWNPKRIDIFGLRAGDKTLVQNYWVSGQHTNLKQNTAWTGWIPLDNKEKIHSGLAVINWSNDRIDIFGAGSDAKLKQYLYGNDQPSQKGSYGWTGWVTLGDEKIFL